MWHGRGHFLVNRHLFLDGALHTHQADAELVFEQFADGAHAAVAEVIDIVHRADVFAQLEEVANRRDEVRGIERARLQRRLETQLDVELQTANLAEVVFARIEKHAVEERGRGLERRRIARAKLAIDFDQGFAAGADGVLIERAGEDHTGIVAIGEENVGTGDAGFGQRGPDFRGHGLVGLEQHFARLPVDQIAHGVGAFEVCQRNMRLRDLGFDQFLVERLGDAAVSGDEHFVVLGVFDLVRKLVVHQAFREVPVELAIAHGDALGLIERAQDFLIGLHAQRAQEDGAEEFPLAVDAHVKNVLRIVLEFHPGAAVGNNLPEEVGAIIGRFVKDAGRAVQLADDYALGTIDDERAVLGHQRDIAEEDFLLLDVADIFRAGIGILVVNG